MLLYKSFGNSKIFVNNFWRQIKQDAQYQQKDILDWAVYLDHLQTVLKEFDPVVASNKEILIWCFQEGL